MADHNKLGREGEEMAAAFLLDNGYNILERNFQSGHKEVDIIAEKDDLVVCVEVKTRNSDFFGDPAQFVSRKKISFLVAAMNNYMNLKKLDKEIRFDIISVIINRYKRELKHYENAFYFF